MTTILTIPPATFTVPAHAQESAQESAHGHHAQPKDDHVEETPEGASSASSASSPSASPELFGAHGPARLDANLDANAPLDANWTHTAPDRDITHDSAQPDDHDDALDDEALRSSLRETFSAFYARVRSPLIAFIRAELHLPPAQASEAEEIAQDAFLRVWRHWPELASRPARVQRCYLYTAARNLTIDRFHRARRVRLLPLSLILHGSGGGEGGMDGDASAEGGWLDGAHFAYGADGALFTEPLDPAPDHDPARVAVARERLAAVLAALAEADPATQLIVALTVEGVNQRAIAVSARTTHHVTAYGVSRIVRRFRTRARQAMREDRQEGQEGSA